MTNRNLVIVTVAILAAISIIAFAVRSSKQNKETDSSEPKSELTVPYGSGDNSQQKKSPPPREVERGTALNPTMPKLTKPEMMIDTNKNYKAIVVTSKGTIKIDLLEKTSPNAVNNFVYLANNQFYNNVIFHRVIKGFMIQGGDPTGTGSGGPGYTFDDEPFEGEYVRGAVAMANAGPNTNGSQFFVMHADTPLPKNYVIFGQVEEGMETVDAIATSEVQTSVMGEMSDPIEPVKIESVEITIE